MSFIKYIQGWISWHIRAGFWFVGLGFRLFFAIGLDSGNDHPGKSDAADLFRCPYPKTYLNSIDIERSSS